MVVLLCVMSSHRLTIGGLSALGTDGMRVHRNGRRCLCPDGAMPAALLCRPHNLLQRIAASLGWVGCVLRLLVATTMTTYLAVAVPRFAETTRVDPIFE